MTIAELMNENMSKKMGIAIVGIVALMQIKADTWQIMAVAITAIIMQGVLDYRKPK